MPYQCRLIKNFTQRKEGAKAHRHTFSSFESLRGISLRLCVEGFTPKLTHLNGLNSPK